MSSIIAFFQNLIAHPAVALGSFTLVSAVLAAVANFMVSLGKTAPGWIGSVLTVLGNLTHLFNSSAPPSS